MSAVEPVRSGIVGLGGYAGSILNALAQGEADDPQQCKLMAAVSSSLSRHAEKVAELEGQGVKCFEDYEKLLAEPIEAVWLPLPIDLHAPYTIRALEAGKAVNCEKPVAGSVDDVNAMIEARDRTGLPVAIGYQDVYDPTTMPAKRKLLDGQIGKITHATLYACWPRDDVYYNRADWAGRFKRGDSWVMDSPANNALAHYINIALFLLGPTIETSAEIESVEAELYRANDIENFDTIAMRLKLAGDVTFQVLLTHACEVAHNPMTTFHGTKGSMTRTVEAIEFDVDGKVERLDREGKPMIHMVRRFTNYVRGIEDNEICLATLEVSKAPLIAVNGASEATSIHTVPASAVQTRPGRKEGSTLQAIPGIEDAFIQCSQKQQLLHESDLFDWTQPAGKKDLRGYNHFAGPKDLNLVSS